MTMSKKPYAEACDKNSPAILEVLKQKLPEHGRLLEIASGTGQHAVYFGEVLANIEWQTSDLEEKHQGIQLWLEEAGLENVLPPLSLDVAGEWPDEQYDAVFSANTAHIMPVEAVEKMFNGIASALMPDGLFLLYGPFMYGGEHSSDSNYFFDCWLKSISPQRGIRDVGWLREIAAKVNLSLLEDMEMPANNRILIWRLSK